MPEVALTPEAMEPLLRTVPPSARSGLLAVLLGCFVVNAFFFPILRRQWGAFFKQLLHPRADFMQVERTLTERMVVALALAQTLVFEGVMLYCAGGERGDDALMAVAGLTLLAGLLMVVQTGGYLAVGYAFADAGETGAWLRAFMLSQSMLGYALMIPAMVGLFYPECVHVAVGVGMAAYVGCRILFIIKGFAFFYTSYGSLFYFFLYLCTLEIVPLVVVASQIEAFSALIS